MFHKILRLFLGLTIALSMTAITIGTQSARAAGPWYVTTAGDDNNDCLSPGTPCATINGAIGKATAGDTVNVAVGTYTGSSTEVVLINRDITLSGGWDATFTLQSGMSTIDGQGARRGVTVNSVSTVEAFIIQNGSPFNSNSGGGIANFSSTLTLNNSIVRGNSTAFGGGIYNGGTLTLNNDVLSGNSATTFGGGILNGGTLTLNNSYVGGNSGGGIANSGGTSTLNNSTVSGNSTDFGGGLINSGGPTGTITLNNTTVSGNSASEDGGGIANFSATGAVTLNYSTVTNNTSDSDNNGTGRGGGIANENSIGSVILQSSIVAGNKKGSSGVGDVTADCFHFGMIVSQGYNLTGSGTGCDPLGGTGDVTVTPANVFTDVVDVLADNGGLTQTHALIIGANISNPALNAIANGTNSCGSQPFSTDQRGVARPQGTACDIGAFELEANGGNESLEVTIDIKPGNKRNVIETKPREPKNDDKVSVAILSDSQFDALQQVDRSSLTFGHAGDEDSLVRKGRNKTPGCRSQDVNKDSLPDLVCQFSIQKAGFQASDTQGILMGTILGGTAIEGRDMVKIVVDN